MACEAGALEMIPKLYFSSSVASMQSPDSDWVRARAEVWRAMASHGCFEAVLPESFPAGFAPAMFSYMQELFALSEETKMRIQYDIPHQGYVPTYPNYPLYEGMGLKDPTNPTNIKSFTNLLWPHGHPSFSETVSLTVRRLSELDTMVRKMIMESLGVEKHFDRQNDFTFYLFRLIRYRRPDVNVDESVGLPPHTDVHLVTILFQDQVSGLEIQTKDGRWLPAFTSPNSFVVMAGDSLRAWSNGRIEAPIHRVMMRRDLERHCMALFTIQKSGQMIEAPEELVDDDHPPLFKPYDALAYQSFRYSPAAAQAPDPLTAFCGRPRLPQLK